MKHDIIPISDTCTRHEYYEDAVYNYPKDSFRRRPCYVCYTYAAAPSNDSLDQSDNSLTKASREIEQDGFITLVF